MLAGLSVVLLPLALLPLPPPPPHADSMVKKIIVINAFSLNTFYPFLKNRIKSSILSVKLGVSIDETPNCMCFFRNEWKGGIGAHAA
jgi:hypothetical protein